MALYHRIPNEQSKGQLPLNIAFLQVHSKELWGRVNRGGHEPAASAIKGALPPDKDGVEFDCDVVPSDPNHPRIAHWHGSTCKLKTASLGGNEYVRLPIRITKLRFKASANTAPGCEVHFLVE